MKSKKGLIIATLCIAASIALMFTVYEVTPILDPVVENVAKALGTKTEKMIKKEKQQEEQAIEEESGNIFNEIPKVEEKFVDSVSIQMEQKRVEDSIIQAKELEKRKLFNAKIDEKAAQRLLVEKQLEEEARKKADSMALALAAAEATKPKRKPLFNTTVNSATVKSENTIQYFDAKVHRTQKFQDNDVVEFRTSSPVKLGANEIPANYVFTAKANVFDGKVHFIVKNINNVAANVENFTNNSPGLPISNEMKLGSAFLISDGLTVKFGIKQ